MCQMLFDGVMNSLNNEVLEAELDEDFGLDARVAESVDRPTVTRNHAWFHGRTEWGMRGMEGKGIYEWE